MSARNRELFALIPVGLLVTAGFTAVLIVESEQLGDLSFIYGLYFLGLCLATHFVIRARLPDADPFLFPLVAMVQGSLAGDGWGNYAAVLAVPGLWRFFVTTVVIAASVIAIGTRPPWSASPSNASSSVSTVTA